MADLRLSVTRAVRRLEAAVDRAKVWRDDARKTAHLRYNPPGAWDSAGFHASVGEDFLRRAKDLLDGGMLVEALETVAEGIGYATPSAIVCCSVEAIREERRVQTWEISRG